MMPPVSDFIYDRQKRIYRKRTPSIQLAPAFVQSRITTVVGPTSTPSIAFSSNNTAGNILMVSISWDNPGATSVSSVSGNGDTYLVGNSLNNGTRQLTTRYVLNCNGGANTVTFTMGLAVSNIDLAVSEYSGLNTFDVRKIAVGTTTTNATTGNFTPTSASESVIAHAWAGLGYTGAGTSYVARTVASSSIVEDRLSAPAGAQAATAAQVVPTACCVCVPEPWIISALVFFQSATNNSVFYGIT